MLEICREAITSSNFVCIFGSFWTDKHIQHKDSLPASRLYDWSVSSEHLGFFLVFFISLFCWFCAAD